ncbi:hypothetical protein K458DRAFT_466854, partial [Lentithecium fluviatile CBS 122367]
PALEWQIDPQVLYGLLNIPNLEVDNIKHVERQKRTFSGKDIARVEQIVRAYGFKSWLITPASTKLLIRGEAKGLQYISPLSHLCSTLAQAFRAKKYTVSLSFFCGFHVHEDDKYYGGGAMLRNWIAQLF